MIETIMAIDASDIPSDILNQCIDVDDEFPAHYSNGIIRLTKDFQFFKDWLKDQDGYIESEFVAVWGT